eukprot:1159033-Pelagomonas_calceolata.AAC.1
MSFAVQAWCAVHSKWRREAWHAPASAMRSRTLYPCAILGESLCDIHIDINIPNWCAAAATGTSYTRVPSNNTAQAGSAASSFVQPASSKHSFVQTASSSMAQAGSAASSFVQPASSKRTPSKSIGQLPYSSRPAASSPLDTVKLDNCHLTGLGANVLHGRQ